MLLAGLLLPIAVFAAVFVSEYRPPLDLPKPFSIPASPAPEGISPVPIEEPEGSTLWPRPRRKGTGRRSTRYQVHYPPSGTGWGVTVVAEPPRGWSLRVGPSGQGTVLKSEDPVLCRREGRCPTIWVSQCDAVVPDAPSPAAVVREEIAGTDGPELRPVGGGMWRRGDRLLQPFPGGGCLSYSVAGNGFDSDPRVVAPLAEHVTGYFGRRAVAPRTSRDAVELARRANRLVLGAPAAILSADTAECRDVSCQDVYSRGRLVTRRAAGPPPYADVSDKNENASPVAHPVTPVRIGSRTFTDGCSGTPVKRRWLGFDPGLLLPTSRWLLSYAEPRREGDVTILEWRSYFDGGRARIDSRTGRLLAYDRVERRAQNEKYWDRTLASFEYPNSIDRIPVVGTGCPEPLE